MTETVTDTRLIPITDYQASLKEIAELKAQLDIEKEKKVLAQRELSQARRKLGVESRSTQGTDSPKDPSNVPTDDQGTVPLGGNQNPANVQTPLALDPTRKYKLQDLPANVDAHGLTESPFCPYGKCDDDNSKITTFKDETVCADPLHVGCGRHLGPLADIYDEVKNPTGKKVRCDNCGGKVVRPLTAKKKPEGFLQSLMLT